MALRQAIDKITFLDVDPDSWEIDWYSLEEEVATHKAYCLAPELFPQLPRRSAL